MSSQTPRVIQALLECLPGIPFIEIQQPGGRRRADLVLLYDESVYAYEVKVSRGDLLSEIKNPRKSMPWMRYSNFFTLAVSSSKILDGIMDDINPEWGIVVADPVDLTVEQIKEPNYLDISLDDYPVLMEHLVRHYSEATQFLRSEMIYREAVRRAGS